MDNMSEHTIEQQLSTANDNIIALESQLQNANADLAAANELLADASALESEMKSTSLRLSQELSESRVACEDLQDKLNASAQVVGELTAEVARLKSDAKSAEARAAEICASVGVQPLAVAPTEETATDQNAVLLSTFRAISDPSKQMAFFRANSTALFAAEAAEKRRK